MAAAGPVFRVFIAASLDGFIARPAGGLDWLPGAEPGGVAAPPDEDHGFAAFLARTEAVVMGRATFEAVRDFSPWPYGDRRLIVLSRTLSRADLPARLTMATVHPGPVEALAAELAAQGVGGVYVDGGQTVQAFLRADLIDELTVTWVPVLLGAGRPLFGSLPTDLWLQHVSTQAFAGSGMVQSAYRRASGGS